MWCPPSISLKWGAYFTPDADDDAANVNNTIAAHDGGIITIRTAIEKVARTFNIENVDQYVEALEEERAAKQEQLAADMHAMADIGGDDSTEPAVGKKPTNKKPPLPKKTGE